MICIYMIYSLLSPHCYDMYYIYFDEVEEVRKTLTFLLVHIIGKARECVYLTLPRGGIHLVVVIWK